MNSVLENIMWHNSFYALFGGACRWLPVVFINKCQTNLCISTVCRPMFVYIFYKYRISVVSQV